MLTTIRRTLAIGAFLSLIITNILTLTSVSFNAALSGVMGTALGIQTVTDIMGQRLTNKNTQIKKQARVATQRKAAVRKFGARLGTRTRRVAQRSIAAIPAEAIPYVGIAALVTVTTYELYQACQNLKDLEVLYGELGVTDVGSDDVMATVCNPQIPSAEALWERVTTETAK